MRNIASLARAADIRRNPNTAAKYGRRYIRIHRASRHRGNGSPSMQGLRGQKIVYARQTVDLKRWGIRRREEKSKLKKRRGNEMQWRDGDMDETRREDGISTNRREGALRRLLSNVLRLVVSIAISTRSAGVWRSNVTTDRPPRHSATVFPDYAPGILLKKPCRPYKTRTYRVHHTQCHRSRPLGIKTGRVGDDAGPGLASGPAGGVLRLPFCLLPRATVGNERQWAMEAAQKEGRQYRAFAARRGLPVI